MKFQQENNRCCFATQERTKRTVLLIGAFLSSSGGSRSVAEDLAIRLEASGWRVLTTSNRPARLPRLFDMMSMVWRRRHEYEVAAVDVFSGPAFLWAELVCWMLRWCSKPYVLTLRGGNLPSFAASRPKRIRRLLESAEIVTTPSRYLLENMRACRSDLRLVANPLELSAYEFKPRNKPHPHLMWLRAFHGIYNPSLAVKVVASLTREFPDASLTMLGPDKKDGSLQSVQRLAAELGVSDQVMIPGRVAKSEVPSCLHRGDIFLNTTNADNTPVSVIEAMACGLCVISTRVGGISYLLQDGHDALLVPANDHEAMAHAVCRILTEPGLGEQLSRNGRLKVERFDWSTILPQWEEILSAVSLKGRNAQCS